MKVNGAMKWGLFYSDLFCAFLCASRLNLVGFMGFMGWLVAAVNWLYGNMPDEKEGGAE